MEAADCSDSGNEALAGDSPVVSAPHGQDCRDFERGCGCGRSQSFSAAPVEVLAVATNNRSLKIILEVKVTSNIELILFR